MTRSERDCTVGIMVWFEPFQRYGRSVRTITHVEVRMTQAAYGRSTTWWRGAISGLGGSHEALPR